MNAPGSTNRAVTTPEKGRPAGRIAAASASAEVWPARLPSAAQVVHGLRHDQVRRLLARLGHAFIVGAGHCRLGLLLDLVGQQFRHFDLAEQLARLDRVALIHRQRFQVAGHFGVKRGVLQGQDAEGGQRNAAGNLAALGKNGLDLIAWRRFGGTSAFKARNRRGRPARLCPQGKRCIRRGTVRDGLYKIWPGLALVGSSSFFAEPSRLRVSRRVQ